MLPCLTTRPRWPPDAAKAALLDLTAHPMMAATQSRPKKTPAIMPMVTVVCVPWFSRESTFLEWRIEVGMAWKAVVLVAFKLIHVRQPRMILEVVLMLRQWVIEFMLVVV